MINKQTSSNFANITNKIRELNADILSLQELTPELHKYIIGRTNYHFIAGIETHCGFVGSYVKRDIASQIKYFGDFNNCDIYQEQDIQLLRTKIPIVGIKLQLNEDTTNNDFDAKYVYFGSMHLPHGKSEQLKQARKQCVDKFISGIELSDNDHESPIIIMGDTNMTKQELINVCLWNQLNDAHIINCNDNNEFSTTWQSSSKTNATMRYDAFLYQNCQQKEYNVFKIDQSLSDHAPITATFDLTQNSDWKISNGKHDNARLNLNDIIVRDKLNEFDKDTIVNEANKVLTKSQSINKSETMKKFTTKDKAMQFLVKHYSNEK